VKTERPIVMVVDDDDATLQTLTQLLCHFGFEVISKNDPDEALAVLRQRDDVAVLVCDFEMPRTNGGELARGAKQFRPGMPVFVFSGSYAPEVPSAPWDAWFLKGLAISELLATLKRFKCADTQISNDTRSAVDSEECPRACSGPC
jgi:CheY-like chemotaxis protein